MLRTRAELLWAETPTSPPPCTALSPCLYRRRDGRVISPHRAHHCVQRGGRQAVSRRAGVLDVIVVPTGVLILLGQLPLWTLVCMCS